MSIYRGGIGIHFAYRCLNRHVRIQTINGQLYEGTVVHIDDGHIYLETAGYAQRQWIHPHYSPAILPLVLYELLVITLLYT